MKNKKKTRRIMLVVLIILILIANVLVYINDPRDWVAGRGDSWALGNFALMNIVVFESFMLLLGGYLTTTRKEDQAREEAAVRVKWLPRLLSVAVMAAALVLFVLVENVDLLPLVWFDRWTWLFALLAAAQTVLVALSRKDYTAKPAA